GRPAGRQLRQDGAPARVGQSDEDLLGNRLDIRRHGQAASRYSTSSPSSLAQPSVLPSNALRKASSDSCANPVSTTVSRVPPAPAGSSVNSTYVRRGSSSGSP